MIHQGYRRHVRRVLTPEESARLIEAAATRPLEEACQNRGSDASLKEETIDKLRWLGATRSHAYKTMLMTGLRMGECGSIRIGDIHLDHEPPYLELRASDEKNRRGARIPLPSELAGDLRTYLSERIARLTKNSTLNHMAGINGEPLFMLPKKMTKVFDKDLVFAGIARKVRDDAGVYRIYKKDDRGRVLDIHCLRHTFITMLAKSGVSLQVAQKAARHSSPLLTANIYTHIDLDDIAEAVNKLPAVGATQDIQANVAAMIGESAVSLKPKFQSLLAAF